MAHHRVWLFRGALDEVVPEAVADSLADDETLRVESGDLQRPASHGIPVESFASESRFPPRDCAEYAPPFVIECGYDAAGLLLRHLYPEGFLLGPLDSHASGSLHAFDQTQFFQPSESAGLSGVGYIYVPAACQSHEYRLHVAFHGCRQNADAQGRERVHDDFVRDAGYNRWAGATRIVVLYPQATEAAATPRSAGTSGATAATAGEQARACRFAP